MKKSSVGSLVVIIGLLILSVITLTAIYATSPETSVVLLDENFSDMNESRWKQDIAQCTEDGNLFQYNSEDGFIADGILRVQPNLTSPVFRIKREDLNKCYFCPDAVADEDFHIYEIRWNPHRITFRIDHKKVDEKTFELSHQARNSSNTASISQPFSLSVGVDFGEKYLENLEKHSENKTTIKTRNKHKRHIEEGTILVVDYVRLFRIERRNWSFI